MYHLLFQKYWEFDNSTRYLLSFNIMNYQSNQFVYLTIYLFIYSTIYLFIYLYIYSYIYIYILHNPYLFIYQFIYLFYLLKLFVWTNHLQISKM